MFTDCEIIIYPKILQTKFKAKQKTFHRLKSGIDSNIMKNKKLTRLYYQSKLLINICNSNQISS